MIKPKDYNYKDPWEENQELEEYTTKLEQHIEELKEQLEYYQNRCEQLEQELVKQS